MVTRPPCLLHTTPNEVLGWGGVGLWEGSPRALTYARAPTHWSAEKAGLMHTFAFSLSPPPQLTIVSYA